MAEQKPMPGTGGEHYIPFEERTGGESAVYLRGISPQRACSKIFDRVNGSP